MAEKGRNTNIVTNRKARFEYFIETVYSAGMVLTGTEVKSLRNGQASLQEAYCFIRDGEVFIQNMNIAEYDKGSYNNHEPRRLRKLLLRKREISKITRMLEQKGYTLVPLKIYFNERNYAKMDIGLAKGKRQYDKRNDIKDRENKRDLARVNKEY